MATNRSENLASVLSMDIDRPLDDVRHASGRTMLAVSGALHAAAANLLTKALRAVRSGEPDRAAAYATKAVQLDFDDHEEMHPAQQEAQMLLFDAVVDALEVSEAGEHSWLDVALAVLPGCGEHARAELLGVLADVTHDCELEPVESRRIKVALAGRDLALDDDIRSVPEAEQVRMILQVLDAVSAYHDALEAAF